MEDRIDILSWELRRMGEQGYYAAGEELTSDALVNARAAVNTLTSALSEANTDYLNKKAAFDNLDQQYDRWKLDVESKCKWEGKGWRSFPPGKYPPARKQTDYKGLAGSCSATKDRVYAYYEQGGRNTALKIVTDAYAKIDPDNPSSIASLLTQANSDVQRELELIADEAYETLSPQDKQSLDIQLQEANNKIIQQNKDNEAARQLSEKLALLAEKRRNIWLYVGIAGALGAFAVGFLAIKNGWFKSTPKMAA